MALILALSVLPRNAAAQTIVSRGMGLAHDCYIIAKARTDARTSLYTCD